MLTFTNDNIFVFILRQYTVHESPLSVPELLNSPYYDIMIHNLFLVALYWEALCCQFIFGKYL